MHIYHLKNSYLNTVIAAIPRYYQPKMNTILKRCSNRIVPALKSVKRQTPASSSFVTLTGIRGRIGTGNSDTRRSFHQSTFLQEKKTVKVTYVDPMGDEIVVDAEVGKHLLDIAQDNNIELEGACGGELACATCHLIFDKDMYETLEEKDPEEDDMLDMAFELTDTSRLGCQITVREDMEGMRVTIPDDGY